MSADNGKLITSSEEELAEKYDPWKAEAFLNELDRRMNSLESGEEKGVSWEEVKAKANKILKSRQ